MFLSYILAKLRRALEARRTARLLATFSDRELEDLGITRHQSQAAVHGNLSFLAASDPR